MRIGGLELNPGTHRDELTNFRRVIVPNEGVGDSGRCAVQIEGVLPGLLAVLHLIHSVVVQHMLAVRKFGQGDARLVVIDVGFILPIEVIMHRLHSGQSVLAAEADHGTGGEGVPKQVLMSGVYRCGRGEINCEQHLLRSACIAHMVHGITAQGVVFLLPQIQLRLVAHKRPAVDGEKNIPHSRERILSRQRCGQALAEKSVPALDEDRSLPQFECGDWRSAIGNKLEEAFLLGEEVHPADKLLPLNLQRESGGAVTLRLGDVVLP